MGSVPQHDLTVLFPAAAMAFIASSTVIGSPARRSDKGLPFDGVLQWCYAVIIKLYRTRSRPLYRRGLETIIPSPPGTEDVDRVLVPEHCVDLIVGDVFIAHRTDPAVTANILSTRP